MGNGDSNAAAIIIICIAIFVGAILALYFLSKMLVTVGIVIGLISLILLIIGLASENGELAIIGGIGLIVGIILLFMGITGVNFFEHNPTGKNLLDSSNTIVNATKEGVKLYSETAKLT
jgi:hypothetical protein